MGLLLGGNIVTLTTQTDRASVHHTLRPGLHNMATRLRIACIRSTTKAGSGHVTSCCSAADIMSVLFFAVMRHDPQRPDYAGNDRFILSKGHAAPLLYAAWAEAGLLRQDELLELRKLDSDLEGHPTPRLPFVDFATGALGQGLSVAAGIALDAKRWGHDGFRTYALLGDGETAEGAVWEAAEFAADQSLNNLCAIVDVNRLGQSRPTRFQHHMEAYRVRWEAVGWHAIVVDGHDLGALLEAFDEAGATPDKPTVILARTLKGKGIPSVEDREGKHGKPLSADEASQAILALQETLLDHAPQPLIPRPSTEEPSMMAGSPSRQIEKIPSTGRKAMATRSAFGDAMVALGHLDGRVVGLDGDVQDSTRMQTFAEAFPDRFIQCFIAEQNMVGVAAGLSACGKVPFAATFACFLTRAHDVIRMAAISNANIKLVGSHAGVSVGQDGPSQMGLEDIAMMATQPNIVVLYPADGPATHRLVQQAANHRGLVYIRTTRGETPTLYSDEDKFMIGGSKILRASEHDHLTLVAAGITIGEALKAYDRLKEYDISARVVDLYSLKPVDRATLIDCARATHGRLFTVEDHYEHGGIGDIVLASLSTERVRVHKLAVREIPRSGNPDELLDRYGISSGAIVKAVRENLQL
ncbi:MAG: Transketolase [Candidatus Nitrospira kreftii]|uniref:Transketolase n=1 Tax=Candidatus Nitrospira kreftii TaxID=2652173 RepID=A0A7S8FEK8_9BACT|nr:MAG: Transketolase [Candidatus Nitrospira kreftii]